MAKKARNILATLKWVGIAYIITLLLIAIYAAILTYTSVPEGTIPTVVLLISIISIIVSSSLSVKKIKEKGLINGAVIGFTYIIILYLLSSIFLTGFRMTTYSIIMILLCGLVGMIGGVIGVNM